MNLRCAREVGVPLTEGYRGFNFKREWLCRLFTYYLIIFQFLIGL